MCGICGTLNYPETEVSGVLRAMTDAIRHRGPDGEGRHIAGPVGLGHRRLAIIDPSGGHQPMSNEDDTIWITYNGEIYNFKELRRELAAAGHVFRTHSDTEMVIHAYEQWGKYCVERFRGMFAFAVADLRRRELFLARDPLGIKPLYYRVDGERIAFASELQAFRAIPGLSWSLDLQAIDAYLQLQYIPAPATVFRGVQKLRPAHRLTLAFDRPQVEPERYWRLQFRPVQRKEEDVLAELDEELRRSVELHLLSDVPFGAFLSGGIDSSAVVGYMARILKQPVKTFSIGFEEKEFDELEYARMVADRWHTEHHEEVVRPDAMGILPDLVRHYGEPFGDASAVPTYYVSRLARQHVPMVLSGDGGDEAFGGYGTYRNWMIWLMRENKPHWKKMLYPVCSALFPRRWPRIEPRLSNWLRFVQQIDGRWRNRLWRKEHRVVGESLPSLLLEADDEAAGYDPLNRVMYCDVMTYLPFDILAKVDVASMMNSLEVRTPIVDSRVMEFAATIPSSSLMRFDAQGRRQGKWPLKRLLDRYYPEEFVHRRKQGFSVPLRQWLGGNGADSQVIHSRLTAADSPLHEWFEPTEVRLLLAGGNAAVTWLFLVLDEWLRQWRAAR